MRKFSGLVRRIQARHRQEPEGSATSQPMLFPLTESSAQLIAARINADNSDIERVGQVAQDPANTGIDSTG
jgi:hypothetical protein